MSVLDLLTLLVDLKMKELKYNTVVSLSEELEEGSGAARSRRSKREREVPQLAHCLAIGKLVEQQPLLAVYKLAYAHLKPLI
jgi:hypothetical protein